VRNRWLKKVLHEEEMSKEQCYMRNRWLKKLLHEEQMAEESAT